MASSGTSYRDHTISDPDSITSSDLLTLSLNQLSKTLPQTIPSRSTMSIYLRWLEIHRQEPSKLTEHWQNTLLHWTQSLRSRGFREGEILREVDNWKQANGPFQSKLCRYPPTKSDIAKAFEEIKTRVIERMERDDDRDIFEIIDRMGDSYRPPDSIYITGDSPRRSWSEANRVKSKKRHPETYDGKPPGNYICNRCGKKGHHLQVCPTNLDPSYDKPPEASYKCEICGERGTHFKSLCPFNKDPYSIYQKRKANGIRTPPSNRGRIFREWEKEIDEQRRVESRERQNRDGRLTQISSSASFGNSSPTLSLSDERLEQLQKVEDMKVRLFMEESYDIDEIMGMIRSKNGGDNDGKRARLNDQSGSSSRVASSSPSPRMFQGLRKRARPTSSDDNTSSPRMEFERAEPSIYNSHHSKSQKYGGPDIEMVDSKVSNGGPEIGDEEKDHMDPFFPLMFGLRPQKMDSDSMSIDDSDVDSSSGMEIEAPTPQKEYSDFVRKLIHKRPEMSEKVNSFKERPTAVDMWKQDDQIRLERMTSNGLATSLLSSPAESKNEESNRLTDSMESFVIAEHVQFDGACDDRPVDENKVSPRKSSTTMERPSPQRKLSNIGKEAIEKVKELTTHVAKDLQTFKSKRGSLYRTATTGFEELSPTKERKKPLETTDLRRAPSVESLSSLRVNAASSALDLTEDNIKGLAPNLSEKVAEGSEHSFGSLEVNVPGNTQAPKLLMKLVNSNPFAVYTGRQSLDATHDHDTEHNEAAQHQDFAEARGEELRASDAADLPMQVAHTRMAVPLPAVQVMVTKADQHSELTGIAEVPRESKTEVRKEDDESRGYYECIRHGESMHDKSVT